MKKAPTARGFVNSLEEKVLICGHAGYSWGMETKSVVLGGAITLLAGGLIFGLGAMANADGSTAPVVSVTTSSAATTPAPSPSAAPSAVVTPTADPVVTPAPVRPVPVETATPAPAPVVDQGPLVVITPTAGVGKDGQPLPQPAPITVNVRPAAPSGTFTTPPPRHP